MKPSVEEGHGKGNQNGGKSDGIRGKDAEVID
jgi:hypothetical protein